MPPEDATVEAGSDVQETQFTAIPNDAEFAQDGPESENAYAAIPGANGHAQPKQNDASHASYGTTRGPRDGSVPSRDTTKPVLKAVASPRALSPDLLRGLLMVLQAIDHCSVSQGAWRHGVALESEADGTIVTGWNHPVPWVARMLTHLCAPGFMFLLGMGVVYFGRSRSKLGWTSWQMVKHFAIRAFVLAAVNEVLFTLPFGRGRIIILNIVLLALAVNYLLAGLLWLVINASEQALSTLLESIYASSDDEAEEPLLPNEEPQSPLKPISIWATRFSWHFHNLILLALAIISIAWNHWLSPHRGHCPLNTPPNYSGPTLPNSTTLGPWFDFWFLSVQYKRVISPFPPLAWLSPAILGLLYGRIILSRPWKPYTINASNAFFG
ncbi:MAG: hypothetical protein Q9169_008304, partial [Polycauliona sp. 2 TL-2023]